MDGTGDKGRGLALRRQTLLGERGLLRHRLVVVGPQPGHHLQEGQTLHLRQQGLCRRHGGVRGVREGVGLPVGRG